MSNPISDHAIAAAQAILTNVTFKFSEWQSFGIALVTVLACATAYRCKRYSHPHHPYLSPIIRVLSDCAYLGTAALLILGAISVAFPAALVGVAYWIDGRNFSLQPLMSGLAVYWSVAYDRIQALGAGSLTGAIAAIPIVFRVIPGLERTAGMNDVRQIVSHFPKLTSFDPRPFFNFEKGCFVGKTPHGKSVFVPWKKLHETHVQVIGTTGSGKGVVMTSIAAQCFLNSEAVIWFDPKADEFTPRILNGFSKETKRPCISINLNDPTPQLNLVANATEQEIADLLITGFDLRAKGSDGDYHRGKDEDAAYLAAKLLVTGEKQSIPDLIATCSSEPLITEQDNFWRHLRKLGRNEVFATREGLQLEEIIEVGGIVYVVGSCDSEGIKMAQKMILVRVMQIIKKRRPDQRSRKICVVLDEFKHLLSPMALTALAVVRSMGAHFLLAHQSLGDLESCPGIPPAEAYGAVIDNTAIKIVYRIGDADYAERLSRNGGQRRTFTENTSKIDAERSYQGGSWREAQEPLIAPDLITHLPMPSDRPGQASTGVLFGIGTASLFHVGPISAAGPMPEIQVAPPVQTQQPQELI